MSAITPSAIQVGAMKIYVGVTDPGDGAVVALSSGVPASGTFLGATNGPAVITTPTQFLKIMAEQETAPVGDAVDIEEMAIEVPAKEFTIANLAHMLPQGTLLTGVGTPTGKARMIGGNTTVAYTTVLGVAPLRSDGAKFIQVFMPRALQTSGVSLNFSRGGETVATLKWEGRADVSRTAGRKLGYIYISD